MKKLNLLIILAYSLNINSIEKIIKKNKEIRVTRQSKEGIAKLICKKIVEEFSS